MSEVQPDTIFALSSAAGKSGVAVIRVSGPKAWEGLANLTKGQSLPETRKTVVRKLINPKTLEAIDEAMVIGFRAPRSFTGEDVIEYQCHGSPAILEEMIDFLGGIEHCRMAEHGEFTRRAFENGRLDLTEAEAIADLIDAETKVQKDQALLQMGGALSNLYHGWAEELTKALAYVEAIIDFPDEDVPDEETAKVIPAIQKLKAEIENHLNDNRRGERLRSGIQVAVIGAPNAGKSSLVNVLTQRDVAIVSDVAGTTRDVIEVHLNLGGYPVILSDTAGLRPDQIGEEGQEGIEFEGIRRALKRAEEADLQLLLFDAAEGKPDAHTMELINSHSIIVVNKTDENPDIKKEFHVKPESEISFISIKTGEGMDGLLEDLTKRVADQISVSRETPSLTRSRHRNNLEECLEHLNKSLGQKQPELMGQELRFAVTSLGRITGRIDSEDLLDIIFKDFCIGK